MVGQTRLIFIELTIISELGLDDSLSGQPMVGRIRSNDLF